ncbi:MAG TPA: hypothetical protein VN717_10920 [Gemmatimonadaceae bacterium]|nr:hypothetical protein [Gemmatimonadaceae bacterium]
MGVSSESHEALIASRRSKRWLAVAAIFTVGNLAGGVVAAAQGEIVHASVHAGLMLLGAVFVWLLASRRDTGNLERAASVTAELSQLGDRLVQIQQSIDAIGIEVERIGEGQRYLTHLFATNDVKEQLPNPEMKERPRSP